MVFCWHLLSLCVLDQLNTTLYWGSPHYWITHKKRFQLVFSVTSLGYF